MADDWEYRSIILPTLATRIKVERRKMQNLFFEFAANWEALEERPHPKVDPKDRARFIAGWQEHRRTFGYTLPAELPWTLRKALQDHDDLDGVDYDLVVVDEYQDLNACDLVVLQLLSERDTTIVGVGDDDQSIYSFRRANPAGIRRFCDDYPTAANLPLSITHRCGARILDWASYVIQQDLGRDPDKPSPVPAEGSPEGTTALLSFPGQRAEAKGIAKLTQWLIHKQDLPPEEILILLKGDHNRQFSNPIREELEALGLQCSDPGGVKEVLAQPQNRALLARCRILVDKTDSLAWATLLGLTPGIGQATMQAIYEIGRGRRESFGQALIRTMSPDSEDKELLRGRAHSLAKNLVSSVLEWRDSVEVPQEIPDGGWGAWISSIPTDPGPTNEMVDLLAAVDSLIEDDTNLSRYLGQLQPLASDQAQTTSRGVRIMSMAASKGLTVQATIVAGVEEGIIPSHRPEQDVDEEKRLLYVAMTRAKRFLFCTWARRRTGATARAGQGRVRTRRNHSSFFDGGPVRSRPAASFLDGLS